MSQTWDKLCWTLNSLYVTHIQHYYSRLHTSSAPSIGFSCLSVYDKHAANNVLIHKNDKTVQQ